MLVIALVSGIVIETITRCALLRLTCKMRRARRAEPEVEPEAGRIEDREPVTIAP